MKQHRITKYGKCSILKGFLGCFSAILLLSACEVDSGLNIVDVTKMPEEVPNSQPASGEARVFTTTGDRSLTMAQSGLPLQSGVNMAPTTIEVDPKERYQSIDGFGFAITYSSCFNLLKMSKEDRTAFLTKTYSPAQGYGVSYARISIGCSDFSSSEYTLCDTKGIENFALQSDEKNYVIPILKEILAINPNLKIIASPWTCPRWMKVKDLKSGTMFNSWTDGHLSPEYRDDYATYFVKFVQAMKQQGINIYAVTPQNEPLNRGNSASLYMPWDEEAAFVRVLASAFKRNSLKTKIYLYDHNYDYAVGQEEYPVKIYNALGNNYEGSELVVGAAYHDYGGNSSELLNIFAKAPEMELIFSESSIGTWNDGHNLGKRLMADMNNVVLGTVNKMCKAVLVWNLMLDDKMGPNMDGGCQTCFGAVDINSKNYKTLTYNSHYYVICQMSSVVSPGAVRIGLKRNAEVSGLTHAEFLNPDGTIACVMCNNGSDDIQVTVSNGEKFVKVSVPAQGAVSCKF